MKLNRNNMSCTNSPAMIRAYSGFSPEVKRSILTESLAMEHHRLHVIERWPEGANKEAALASVQSALDGLRRDDSAVTAAWRCIVCGRVPEGAQMIAAAA